MDTSAPQGQIDVPPPADARSAYGPQVSLYMQENAITWARFNALITANAFVFAAVGVNASAGLYLLALVLPLFGLCLCFWWGKIMDRGFAYMNHWRDEVLNSEKLGFEPSLRAVNNAETLRKKPELRAKHFAAYVIKTMGVLYLFAFVQVAILIVERRGSLLSWHWVIHPVR